MSRPAVDTIQYANFRSPNWYTRVHWPTGQTMHSEPWLTEYAAELLAQRWRERYIYLARRTDIGDGDTCPLFPEHGNMFTLQGSDPPMQWCPHSDHTPASKVPASRAKWPLHGFEESVATYMRRLDRAIEQADLPDLSDLEVL